MRLAEVPDEWLVAAHNAYYDDVHPSEHIATWRAMRAMLAAVLPLIEQQVRQQIAAELSVMVEPEPPDNYAVPAWHDGYETAMEAAVRMVGRIVEAASGEAAGRA